MVSEQDRIRSTYDLRDERTPAARYSPIEPYPELVIEERRRAIVRIVRECSRGSVDSLRVIEVGCGTGSNLLELLHLGFLPENLTGIELLERRAKVARHRLPSATSVIFGDACDVAGEFGQVDIVLQSTVFSSLLDDGFQERLASSMWQLTRPGGGILWYDFTWNIPSSKDVRGVPIRRIRRLFPDATLVFRRVTLAPPIGRVVAGASRSLFWMLNAVPFLRSHVLCWIQKRR